MQTVEQDGWVMVDRGTGFIVDFTWRPLRRDAIRRLHDIVPTYSRRAVTRRWKVVKAVRTITLQ